MAPVVLLKPDPLGLPRNPLAVYLLVLTLLSGVGTMSGLTTARSIEATLPHYVALAWGTLLSFGSLSTLVGMFWPGAIGTGLLGKRVGMFTLAVAATVYSVVILVSLGTGGILSAGIIAGFAVACAMQFVRIEQRIRAILKATSS